MFDPAACAAMQIGAPHVSTEALGDLHRLLMEHGLRRSFPDDADVVQEDRHEERAKADRRVQAATPALHGIGFVGAKAPYSNYDCDGVSEGSANFAAFGAME